MAVLQADLERMKMENLKLRGLLCEVTSNYNALQMHFMAVAQDQQTSKGETNRLEEEDNNNNDDKKKLVVRNETVNLVPRQFMDLGLAAAAATGGDIDELSQSSSEGRSGDRSKSPAAGNNEEKKGIGENKGVLEREESPDLGSNKIARLNSSSKTSVDQTEATIRKARVSVRARSEAPMVLLISIY